VALNVENGICMLQYCNGYSKIYILTGGGTMAMPKEKGPLFSDPMEENDNTLATRVKKRRNGRKMNQAELVNRLGVARS